MKKKILLLLMAVLLAGFAFAGVAHPPGDFTPEMVLAEYSVLQDVVTQSSVLVVVPLMVEPSNFQAVLALYNLAGQPQILIKLSEPFNGMAWDVSATARDQYYHLRC